MNGAAGHQHDVEVGQHQGAECDPRVQHVPRVQLADLCPDPVPHRMFREVLQATAGDVAARMAGQRVHPQHDYVHNQNQVAQTESEAGGRVERDDRVVGVDHSDDEGGIEEVAVRLV